MFPPDVGGPDLTPTVIGQVVAPAPAGVGQTVDRVVQVESTAVTHAVVRVAAGSGTPAQATTALVPGRNDVHVSVPLLDAGLTPVRATVRPVGGGSRSAPGSMLAAIDVQAAPRVLLVQDASTARPPPAAAAWPSRRRTRPGPGRPAGRPLLDQLAAFAPLADRLPLARLAFVGLQQASAVASVLLLLLHVAARRWPLNARGTL